MATSTAEKGNTKNGKQFKFELITPQEVLLSLDVNKLIAKSTSGEFGILPNHADMISQLDNTTLRYWYSGQEEFVAVMGGVIEVKDNKVTVISDYAERGEDIDEAKTNAETEKAKLELQMLKEKDSSQKDLLIAEYRLNKEMLRLNTAKMRRNK